MTKKPLKLPYQLHKLNIDNRTGRGLDLRLRYDGNGEATLIVNEEADPELASEHTED